MSGVVAPPARSRSEWKWVTLADVGKVVTGNTPPTADAENYGDAIPFVKPTELVDRGIRSAPSGLASQAVGKARVVPVGAVLVSCIGNLGKTGIARVPVAFNQQINAVVFHENIAPEFGFYYLQTLKPWLYGESSATTIPIVNKGKFQQARFPLAPLEEQREIVAEIEKQFSRLDEAVANLQRVKANLKRYKAAILKAAVEGSLVETEASLAHREGRSYESGEQLLQRVLEERRAKWVGKGKRKESICSRIEGDSDLPEGWASASIDQVAYVDIGFAFKSAEFNSEGIRLLRGENIEPGKLRWVDTRYWPESRLAEYKNLLLEEGEIILAMDRPLVSAGLKLARVKASDLPCLLVQRVARLRCVDKCMEPYLHACMSTKVFERHLVDGQTGTQLPHVSGASICAYLVPLPPVSEQIRIAAEVDRHLSIIREVETEVDTNLQRAQALRQSTLTKAFFSE